MLSIDFDLRQLSKLLATFPAHLPISYVMEAADPQKQDRWWCSQREHVVS